MRELAQASGIDERGFTLGVRGYAPSEMIGWWNDEFLSILADRQIEEHQSVPVAERCWKCDVRRCHDGCAAGLCETCCKALRASAA